MARITPGTRAAWQAEARQLFRQVPDLLARYGVAPAPELQLLDDPSAAYSYYDLQRCAICACLPDAGTPAGAFFWLFASALLDLPSQAAVLEFGRWFLVYVVGHETGHHLRHRYAAYTSDRWLEEHVANELGLGLAMLFPGFRRRLPAMRPSIEKAAARLAPLAGGHVAWAHRDVGEVLVATGIVGAAEWRSAQELARRTGMTPEAILEAGGLRHEAILAAERERAEVADHLRQSYLSDLMEYGAFHLTWLADLVCQPDPPELGASVAAHLLTPAWEDRQRHAVRLFLRRTLTSGGPAAPGAVAVLVREEGEAAVPWLAGVFPQRTPAVQAAILRALTPLPAVPDLLAACARILSDAADGDLPRAASLYLLRHDPGALRRRQPDSVWSALAELIGNSASSSSGSSSPGSPAECDGPPPALAAAPQFALQALGDVLCIAPELLEGLPLATWIRPFLRREEAGVRLAALGLLPGAVGMWRGSGLEREVAALAASEHAGERRAALAALEGLERDARRALLFPQLAAAAERVRFWGDLAQAAHRHGCHVTLVDLLRHRHAGARSAGLECAATLLDDPGRSAARAVLDDAPDGSDEARRLFAAGLPAGARPAVADLLDTAGAEDVSRDTLRTALLSADDPLVRAAARREFDATSPGGGAEQGGMPEPALLERALRLRTLAVFGDLGNDAVLALAAACREWAGEPGEVMPVPGGQAPALHVLVSGHAELCTAPGAAPAGWPLRPGAFFGEECLWAAAPAAWTVRCGERCRFLSLDGCAVAETCREEPELLWHLVTGLARRLRGLAHLPRSTHRRRLHGHHPHVPHHPAAHLPWTEAEKLVHLAALPLLRGCRPASLRALLAVFHTVDLGDGEVLLRAGEPARRLCVVARGHVLLRFPGRPEVERLGPGDSFGEVSLVDGRGEPWEVRADGHCRLLAGDGEVVRTVARGDAGLLAGLLRALHGCWHDAWRAAGTVTPRHSP